MGGLGDRRLSTSGRSKGITPALFAGRSGAGLAAKRRLIVTTGYGSPLAVTLTGGHRHDVAQLLLLDAIADRGPA